MPILTARRSISGLDRTCRFNGQRRAALRIVRAAMLTVLLSMTAPRARAESPPLLPDLIPKLLPSVVNIAFYKVVQNSSAQLTPTGKGLGSGYVVDARGIIATNRHVTDGGNQYFVTFSTGLQLKATLIYRSPDIDLALLRVFADAPLAPVTWGDSDTMRQGDPVIAIGNPLGLAGTVTTGIISARDRTIHETDLDAFLQIDAPINPGNSGGPLFNSEGKIIGMNTALFSVPGADAAGSIGLNFAIPGNDVQFILNSLRAHGRVQRGSLGADLQDVTGELANALGLPRPAGAVVSGVPAATPAAKAGLQVGDILMQIGTYPIHNLRDATRAIAVSDAAIPLPIVLMRGGNTITISAQVTNASDEMNQIDMTMARPTARPVTEAGLGVKSQQLDDVLRKQFKLDDDAQGVVLTDVDPDGLAAALGFNVADIILQAQDIKVRNVQDIVDAADRARQQRRNFIGLLVANGRGTHWATIPVTQ